MEIPRHWRLGQQRLRFIGFRRENGNGVEYSLTGTHWVGASPNGHRKDESPLQDQIIYQAPVGDSVSEQELIPIQGGMEISVSAD